MNNGKQPITPSMWTKCGEGADDYQPLKDGQKIGWETKFGGLTKLEYFTAKAMQGMLAACQGFDSKGMDYLAECAVLQASAVLSLLEKLETTDK